MYNCPYPTREPRAPMPMNRPIYPRPLAYRPLALNPRGMIPPLPAPIPILVPPPALAPAPAPAPPILNPMVNVIRLEDKGKEKSIQFEVMPALERIRQDHAREEESDFEGNRHEGKETSREGESSKKPRRVKRIRRKITIKDFPLSRGHESYDLVEDIGMQKPNITYPQLLELSPYLRKKSSKLSSTRASKEKLPKSIGLVRSNIKSDVVPILDACVC